jgi:hypothetical protein
MTEIRPRLAQPGDLFILLEPSAEEVAALRRVQQAMQARFGGFPHQRLHLTCQRFEAPDGMALDWLIEQFNSLLLPFGPIPVVATGMFQRFSPFWGSMLLQLSIAATDEICHFVETLETILQQFGIDPHFTCADWQNAAHVTLLEGTREEDVARLTGDVAFPQQVFTARHVVFSRINGHHTFEIVEQIDLLRF